MSDISTRERTAIYRNQANKIIKTLPDGFKEFFRDLRLQNKSELTIKQYAYDIKGFVEYLFSSKKATTELMKNVPSLLDSLSVSDLRDYIEDTCTYKKDKTVITLSPEYTSRKMASLRSLYDFFYRTGEINSNPAVLLRNPKLPEGREIITLNNDEIERIFNVLYEDGELKQKDKKHKPTLYRNIAIIGLLLTTGMRVSELCNIDNEDLRYGDDEISIVRKGGKGQRITIDKASQELIVKYVKEERTKLLGEKTSNALFISNKGTRITSKSIENIISDAARKANINKKVTPHTFRRTFGTHLYETTHDIKAVAKALGHSSITTTQAHYAKDDDTYLKKAIKDLNLLKDIQI